MKSAGKRNRLFCRNDSEENKLFQNAPIWRLSTIKWKIWKNKLDESKERESQTKWGKLTNEITWNINVSNVTDKN